MVAELVLEHVAATVNISQLAVREPLLYRDGDVTHFGMVSTQLLIVSVPVLLQVHMLTEVLLGATTALPGVF